MTQKKENKANREGERREVFKKTKNISKNSCRKFDAKIVQKSQKYGLEIPVLKERKNRKVNQNYFLKSFCLLNGRKLGKCTKIKRK